MLILQFCCLFSFVLTVLAQHDYPFMNSSLPWYERVDDLVERLTLLEVQTQLSSGQGQAPPIKRLGIKDYSWLTNCARGDVDQNATSFPQAIGLGASFDKNLVYAVAEVTSTEVRATYNYFRSIHKPMGIRMGISCFSPNVDPFRDPRWGRGEETFSEDPYMAGEMGHMLVKGLHGDHPRYLRTSSGCKHFAVSGGPETNRFKFDTKVSEYDFRTYFLPSFKRCVEAGAYSLICSYNEINGVPACANKQLLTDILRHEWNFTGYVLADAGEIANIIYQKHYYNNTVDAAAGCLSAGCNVEVVGSPNKVYSSLITAINKGKLTEKFVRDQIRPLWYTRLRLGEFDPPAMNPYNKLSRDHDVLNKEHIALAELAAQRSFVLLKNKNNFLPVKQTFDKIAVLGPLSNNSSELMGDYTSITDPKFIETPLAGLRKLSNSVNHADGCSQVNCTDYDSESVVNAIQGVQAIFVVLGTGTSGEHESHDRVNIQLPGKQMNILQDVANRAHAGVPVILLLVHGGPVDINWAVSSPGVTAILDLFLPAQTTGSALHNVLTMSGPDSVPAARVPYTWLADENQVPAITNYTMEGRTYWYFNGEPTFPFGYGLSYTTFTYSDFKFDNSVQAGNQLKGSVVIHNTGQYDADEVVQVYISWQNHFLRVPKIKMVAFDRIHGIKSQSSVTWSFVVEPKEMAVYEESLGWKIEPGEMDIYIGGQQPNQVKSVGSNVEHGTFAIQGSKNLGKY